MTAVLTQLEPTQDRWSRRPMCRAGHLGVGLVGLGLIVAASGLGRPRTHDVTGRQWVDGVDVGSLPVVLLDVWWPVLAVGIAMVIGAGIHAVVDPLRAEPSPIKKLAGQMVGVVLVSGLLAVAWSVLGWSAPDHVQTFG